MFGAKNQRSDGRKSCLVNGSSLAGQSTLPLRLIRDSFASNIYHEKGTERAEEKQKIDKLDPA